MAGVPKLFDLCVAVIANEVPQANEGGDILSVIYELPSELFESLLPHLSPLALQKLQENLPFDFRNNFEHARDYDRDCRKRRRYGILETTWRALYKVRWSGFCQEKQAMAWLDKCDDDAEYEATDDWQQMYWETHLQECVDAVAETALLPSYSGSIGEIQIPDGILKHLGSKSQLIKLKYDYLKFSCHCQQFGVYVRQLRLPNALCVGETCDLLQSSKLDKLELQWIKSNDHVEGLCKLLNQNVETLRSIDFIHCKLSPTFINAIFSSLHIKGLHAHGIEHFSIKRSSFLQTDSSPVPVGLISFLTSGRSLHSLILCDDQLARNFGRVIFNSLLDASACISKLDLSENNISGFLSKFRWRSSNCSLGMDNSLKSLRVLNLRSCNLGRDDADCLKQALVHMPNLENLDLSDNYMEDGIGRLVTYFTEISGRHLPFAELKLENCELTCDQVIELLGVVSNMNKPLKMLSLKGNGLGSKIGSTLGRFLCTGICSLDVEDIGLGSSGFLEAGDQISKELKIAYINIRGKLKHLDLAGNSFCDQLADATCVLAEFRSQLDFPVNLLLSAAPNVPYDNDP
ncbi:hypothetical protein OROGR_002750 [Orobanche gracilis]